MVRNVLLLSASDVEQRRAFAQSASCLQDRDVRLRWCMCASSQQMRAVRQTLCRGIKEAPKTIKREHSETGLVPLEAILVSEERPARGTRRRTTATAAAAAAAATNAGAADR